MPTPPLTPQTTFYASYPQFFQVSTLFNKKELLENSEKDGLFYEGTLKLPKIMNTVLLSQGLLSMILGSKTIVISKRQYLHK